MTSPETEPGPVQGTPLLNAALAAFQLELPHVEAKETGDAGSYQYKYAGLGSVSKKILPLLAKHGLSFTAAPTVTDAGKFVLRYRLLHESGQERGGEYPLSGGNAQAQGSSITYARRYSLLAATGVSPDQDDDDAAANVKAETTFPEQPTELQNERERVRGAWAYQFGTFNQPEAEARYRSWSDGGSLTAAGPAELRRFAAYLSNLPKADAGSDPATADVPAADAASITPRQRGKLFALMQEIGLHDKGAQLEWINKQLKTGYESRSLITAYDAKILIDGLQKGIDTPAPESEPAE